MNITEPVSSRISLYKKSLTSAFCFSTVLLISFFVFGAHHAFAYSNLLTNPGAESNSMAGWTVDNNGGDGWSTTWDNPGHSDNYLFTTSFGWDTRHQTIDLVAAGYTTGQLDSGTFSTKMSEWLATRGDQGGQYYLTFKLLAGDGTTVLATYSRGSQGSPIILPGGTAWFQETHTFSNIPSGTRYIYFEDGGRDVSGWVGNYGTMFDDASVVLSDTTMYDLLYTAGANGSFTGTISQTVSSGSNATAVTAVPAAHYHFVNWSDASTANPRTDTGVISNISVTANFAINTYSLIYTAGANGTITGSTSQTVNYGADGTAVTAVPTAGYSFINWSDASTANPRTDTAVAGTVSVTANFADITSPVIAGISPVPGQTSATITWSTDEASSSLVVYGLTNTYGSTTSETDTSPRTLAHLATLSGLTCNTLYYFDPKSADASSNIGQGSGSSFTTTACPRNHGGAVVSVAPSALPAAVGQNAALDFSVGSVGGHISSPQLSITMNADPNKVSGYALSLDPLFLNDGIHPYTGQNATFTIPNTYGSYTLYLKYYSTTGTASKLISRTVSYMPQAGASISGESSGAGSVVPDFKSTLSYGSKGLDVKTLQQFLNTHGFPVAVSGPGSLGNETSVFSNKVLVAVKLYQKAKGIKPVTGIVGSVTKRAMMADASAVAS